MKKCACALFVTFFALSGTFIFCSERHPKKKLDLSNGLVFKRVKNIKRFVNERNENLKNCVEQEIIKELQLENENSHNKYQIILLKKKDEIIKLSLDTYIKKYPLGETNKEECILELCNKAINRAINQLGADSASNRVKKILGQTWKNGYDGPFLK